MNKKLCIKRSFGVIAAVIMLASATGCMHEHEFTEATCTEPRTCTECGETEGEALGHDFSEATCTEPKICKVCGETEGEALGHTVSIGTCKRCGESINYDEVEKILSEYKSANSYWDTAYQYIINADASRGLDRVYRDYCSAYDYVLKYQNALKKVSNICDKYPELKSLSNALDKIKSYNLRKPASSSADDLAGFTDQLVELLRLGSDFATEASNWSRAQ